MMLHVFLFMVVNKFIALMPKDILTSTIIHNKNKETNKYYHQKYGNSHISDKTSVRNSEFSMYRKWITYRLVRINGCLSFSANTAYPF